MFRGLLLVSAEDQNTRHMDKEKSALPVKTELQEQKGPWMTIQVASLLQAEQLHLCYYFY